MNPAAVTPATLNTIRRNAGRVPPPEIARSLGWSLPMLERVARERQISLSLNPLPPDDPPCAPRADRAAVRSTQLTVSLFPSDLDLVTAIAHETGQRRAGVVSRVIENARARNLLLELAQLPAPMPDKTGNLDE